jgi:hypothetical protein
MSSCIPYVYLIKVASFFSIAQYFMIGRHAEYQLMSSKEQPKYHATREFLK